MLPLGSTELWLLLVSRSTHQGYCACPCLLSCRVLAQGRADYHGFHVNLAARLMGAAAAPGQVVTTIETAERIFRYFIRACHRDGDAVPSAAPVLLHMPCLTCYCLASAIFSHVTFSPRLSPQSLRCAAANLHVTAKHTVCCQHDMLCCWHCAALFS